MPASAARSADLVQAPVFEVDPLWPKPLPNHWVLGSVVGISVDSRDHVWIIHRPESVDDNLKAAIFTPPIGTCCVPAPPVLEFDLGGNLVGHWGGPGPGYQWPTSNHGITVDHRNHVWIGGNDEGDSHVLKFDASGGFLLQIGRQGQAAASAFAASALTAAAWRGPESLPLASGSRSTNSMTAIGALSPKRKPALNTRV